MTVKTLLDTLDVKSAKGKTIRILLEDDKRKNLGSWIWNTEREVKSYQIKSKFILIYV